MQVSVEETSDLERRVKVGVPAEAVDNAVEQKLREASKNMRLDGFRPGKVPVREVRRRYGQAVRDEVLGEVMREYFIKALEDKELEPAGMPRFETTRNEPGADVEFVATFEVFPRLELASFDKVEVEKPVAEITEDDVEQMIENLRKQKAQWKEVDRAAAEGDRVNIDYQGTRDGEAFDGGSAEGQDLTLGSGQMIPGFEDGIVGLKAGEGKILKVTFPEDYQSEELQGKEVEFEVKVNRVEELELPEVDEEFRAAYGVTEGTLEDFRAEVRRNMERELSNAVRSKLKEQVMDRLVELHDFEVPDATVDSEIQRMRQSMVQQFGGGEQFDASMLPDDLFRDRAERSVRMGLIMRTILEDREIKADPEKVRERVEEIASQYEQPQEVVSYIYGNQQQLQQVEGAVLEEQVVELVLDQAKVEEKTMSYEDAVKPSEE